MKPLYITYHRIDKQKWNNCIQKSKNGLIYATTAYLDAMTENKWDALVEGDYHAVMPLTFRIKYGFKYLYQPPFVQQLGIFSAAKITASQTNLFITEAQKKFRFAEYTFNAANPFPPGNYLISPKINYLLTLQKPHLQIANDYQPSFKKSLRRLQKLNLEYSSTFDIEKAISLYRDLYSHRIKEIKEGDVKCFKKLCRQMAETNQLCMRKVTFDNRTVAINILFKYNSRLYNIISCITDEGKKMEANYFLYDKIIEEFSSANLLLDFEGSDIAGVATFYKKMSPQSENYSFLKYNNLPALVKIFKA